MQLRKPPPSGIELTLPKELGFWALVTLVAGNMIGSGVFLLPSSLAPYGGISIVGWVFTGMGAVLLALVFAELAGVYPMQGGPYAYSFAVYGEFGGFLIAWGYWLSILTGNAAIATALVGYLGAFWRPFAQNAVYASLLVLCSIWAFTAVNVFRVRAAGQVQFITLILKILPLLLVGVFGLMHFHPEQFSPLNRSSMSDFQAVNATATLTLWAFLGLESATIPAGYVRCARKRIPLATIIGTVLALAIYLLATLGVMGSVPFETLQQSTSPFADAAGKFLGRWGSVFVALAAIISCAGALNGWILLQGQIPLAAAKDRLFPSVFSRLSPRGTPAFALISSSVLVSFFAMLNYFKSIADVFTFVILLSTLASLLPYLFCSVALPLFRRQNGLQGKLWINGVAVGAFFYSLWAIAGAGEETIFWGFLLLMAGLPVYVGIKFWR